jgi:hypothetical protein
MSASGDECQKCDKMAISLFAEVTHAPPVDIVTFPAVPAREFSRLLRRGE